MRRDVNGRMPAKDLAWVTSDCQAERAAAPSLGLLLATARNRGVALNADHCYRPLSGQVAVRKSWTAAGNSSCAARVIVSPSGKPKGTSMHGWGRAADVSDASGGLKFDSATYRFLVAQAGRFGWNRPGWARPGGSTCPEPWHWEWVGNGGTEMASPIRADVVGLLPGSDGQAYSVVTGLGALLSNDEALSRPLLPGTKLRWLVVGAARTPDGGGYWLAASDGSVFSFGTARNYGSPSLPPGQPVVGIAPSSGGRGYWLVTADGNVMPFGAAPFYGSPKKSKLRLARPIVAVAATPNGQGYWLATADGAVHAYGDARFYGDELGRHHLPAPVVGIAATPDGSGYWLVGSDGSVYPFGNAEYFGQGKTWRSAPPVVSIVAMPDGGYWLVRADGGVFACREASP